MRGGVVTQRARLLVDLGQRGAGFAGEIFLGQRARDLGQPLCPARRPDLNGLLDALPLALQPVELA